MIYDDWTIQAAHKLSVEERAKLLKEHYQLRQCLCAQILGVATGADDWIERAMARADHLRDCEHYLRTTLAGLAKLQEEATYRTNLHVCQNCMGRKTVGADPCCVCKGTGRRPY